MVNRKLNLILNILLVISFILLIGSVSIFHNIKMHSTFGWIFSFLIIAHILIHLSYLKNIKSIFSIKKRK
jgi:hypothetical protein